MSRFNPVACYRELRHRRVFRVAALYAVGAWGVIAACDVIFPQLTGWVANPDAAMRTVFITAIVLAPAALVLGWLYDITPGGVQRTASFSASTHDSDTSLHQVDRWILAAFSVLSAAVLVAAGWHIVRMTPRLAGEPADAAIPENSIAVLPFEVCAGAEVNPLLAAGVANEVLRHLAEVPNLKVTAKSLIVIARASAFAFADTDAEPRRIASTLRVHYLLSGTLCRQGGALTVRAELVDGRGYLVWSHEYAEQLDAAGRVTRPVAALLAEGVAGRLGAVIAVPQEDPVDRLAYEQLLIGREFLERGDDQSARAAFEAALDRKPDYAEALYELALLELPGGDSKGMRDGLEKTMLLSQRALAMAHREVERNPNSSNAHYVTGRIQRGLVEFDQDLAWRTSGPQDIEGWKTQLAEAEGHLRRALEFNPTDWRTSLFLFYTLDDEGRESEALSVLEQAVARDPFNVDFSRFVALRWADLGRYDEAMALLERFRQLPEPPGAAFSGMLLLEAKRRRVDAVCETLIDVLQNFPGSVQPRTGLPLTAWRFGEMLRGLGLEYEAAAWLNRLDGLVTAEWARDFVLLTEDELNRRYYAQASRMSDAEILDRWSVIGHLMLRALALHGEYERPLRLLEQLRRARWGRATFREYDLEPTIFLAALYLEVGRDADARQLLDDTRTVLESRVQGGNRNLLTLDHLATVYAMQGRFPDALATLKLSVEAGNSIESPPTDQTTTLRDPYAPVRAEPRFQALLRQSEMEQQRQADRVRSLLAEHDLDHLLAPLIAIAEENKKEAQGVPLAKAGT